MTINESVRTPTDIAIQAIADDVIWAEYYRWCRNHDDLILPICESQWDILKNRKAD